MIPTKSHRDGMRLHKALSLFLVRWSPPPFLAGRNKPLRPRRPFRCQPASESWPTVLKAKR
jgi:hypothetical protein